MWHILLLLLRSPAVISLGFTIWDEIFAYVAVLGFFSVVVVDVVVVVVWVGFFFNPTIEIVTFRLRGWCMLGTFLLPAFTRLRHERQDLLSPRDGMHECTDYEGPRTPRFILSSERVLGGTESEPMWTPTEKSRLPEKFRGSSEEDGTHDAASSGTASSAHYQGAIPALGTPMTVIYCAWSWESKQSGSSPVPSNCVFFFTVVVVVVVVVIVIKKTQPQSEVANKASGRVPSNCVFFAVDRLVGLVVKASASRAEDPGFESSLRRDFFGVESYQWLKHWHSSRYPARRLALQGQHWDWSARCQYTVTGWGRKLDLQLVSQCGST